MKHTKTNYKANFGITLIEAKEIVKNRKGRLPRPGWEALVFKGVSDGHKFEVMLQNNAGKFSIRKWTDVNFSSD